MIDRPRTPFDDVPHAPQAGRYADHERRRRGRRSRRPRHARGRGSALDLRCTAITSTGRPCRGWADLDGPTCWLHRDVAVDLDDPRLRRRLAAIARRQQGGREP